MCVNESEYQRHRKNLTDRTILLSINGTIGNLALYKGEQVVLGKSAAFINLCKGFSRRFVAYCLKSRSTSLFFDNELTGTTISNLSLQSLRNTPIPLPRTIAEQRGIATALYDMDALLGALERLVSKKHDLKKAAKQQLLTGRSRLPGFQAKWEVKRLGDLATFHKGKGLPKSALSTFGSEPCIHYGELFTQYAETIEATISRTNKSPDQFRSVGNDVVMPTSDVTPRGLAKASCVSVDDVVLGGDILVIRTDPNILFGSFLSYVIRREDDQVLRLVTGTTVFHLYASEMKQFTFSMPLVEEQKAIVAILSDMDAELAAMDQLLDKTRALKQGMMQELLTGKTRLVPVGGTNA